MMLQYVVQIHWVLQVVVEPIQAVIEAPPAPGSNSLPRAMQLVTNVAVLMHALPHLDDFTLLSARSVCCCCCCC